MAESLQDLRSTNLKLKFNLRRRALFADRLLGRQKQVQKAFEIRRKRGLDSIPVFIISYDRLTYLDRTVKSLERCGISNIHIIDNASTYPPLLKYYEETPYDVIYVGENLGSRVFTKSEIFDKYRNDFYIITDSDIELVDECPADVIRKLFDVLEKYPFVRKVGVSLKIDDLPDTELSDEIKNWESQFYKAPIKGAGAYYASVDTTFGLWLPDDLAEGIPFLRAIRTAWPYQARHLPWYKGQDEADEEDIYYSEHRSNGWWDMTKGEITPD